MSLKSKKAKLWKLISEYVRRKDADSQGYTFCYTCGVVGHWKEMDAGHGIPGRKNYVLFNLDLLRAQCKSCNGFRAGEQYIFGKKLNQENGEGWYEQELIKSRAPYKLYESDIDEMIIDIKKKLDGLPKHSR